MSSCCRLHIHLPMDVLLPEEGNSGASAADNARTGVETIGMDSLSQSSQRQTRVSEAQENVEQSEASEVKARSDSTTSQQSNLKQTPAVRKPRARTKGLVKNLQEQIDFYFGDANLPKDKFLQQKIKEHPEGYVSLDLIASFKKMTTLTSDRALILKATQNSSIVELSEDKLWLRRVAPLPSTSSADVDSRTIYVENLSPQNTDHDSVRNMFKHFGTVTYVSIPKHKGSGQIKGFAFIEYSTPDEAKAAVEYFANKDKMSRLRKPSVIAKKGCGTEDKSTGDAAAEPERPGVEPADSASTVLADSASVEPGVSASISMEEEECDVTKRGEKREREEEKEEEEEENGKKERQSQPSAKRPRMDSSEPGTVFDEAQQETMEQQSSYAVSAGKESCKENGENVVSVSDSSLLKSSRIDSQSSETDLDGTLGEGKGRTKKKKNRQHKKKQWAAILRDMNLRVMSKTEWLEMKKMFCDLQKEHMRQLKLDMGSRSTDKEGMTSTKKKKGFVANCLLKVTCSSEAGANIAELKTFCSKFGEVAYMDIKHEDKEGYIRFRESGCVETLLESEGLPDVVFSGVQEEDERAYYLKSQAQRKQKFLKQRRKVRGQDKLISKVLRTQGATSMSSKTDEIEEQHSSQEPTHIRFSDSDSESNTS